MRNLGQVCMCVCVCVFVGRHSLQCLVVVVIASNSGSKSIMSFVAASISASVCSQHTSFVRISLSSALVRDLKMFYKDLDNENALTF